MKQMHGADSPTGARQFVRRALAATVRRLPARLRGSLLFTTLVLGPVVFTLRSWLRLLALQKLGPAIIGRVTGSDGLVALGVRDWAGRPLYVRPGTTDWETAQVSLIGQVHRPPPSQSDVRTILDLGANIGATVADLADAYPTAQVLGIELDAANVAVAERNTAGWWPRASILHGAVWTEDGEVAYGGDRGEWAYRVLDAMDDRTRAAELATVPAFSLATLIDRLSPGGSVDYVKMDVEGAERFLLANGDGWSERVRCLQVEVHLPFDVAGCARMMEDLGFQVTTDPTGIPSVTGLR
jgi:FkbM family methyltransferase